MLSPISSFSGLNTNNDHLKHNHLMVNHNLISFSDSTEHEELSSPRRTRKLQEPLVIVLDYVASKYYYHSGPKMRANCSSNKGSGGLLGILKIALAPVNITNSTISIAKY